MKLSRKEYMRKYNREYMRRKNSEDARRKGGLLCPICGLYAERLGNHIYSMHKITAREFRINNGMNLNESLITKEQHDKFVKNGIKIGKSNLKELYGDPKFSRGPRKDQYCSEKDKIRRKIMCKSLSYEDRTKGNTSEKGKKVFNAILAKGYVWTNNGFIKKEK